METKTLTIQEFIDSRQLEMQYVKVLSNPLMDDPKWEANHYQVTIRQVGRGNSHTMTLHYSMGIGLKRKPTLADVLDCVAMDASGYENSRNFEDWCAEYGYDTDSRKAEKIYNAVAEQTKQLRKLLGASDFDVLLNEVEQL